MKAGKVGILSALLASACCVGPIVLVLLGLGSVGLASFLGKYHWYLQGAAVVVLALAWGIFLREKRRMHALASEMRNERLTRIILMVVSLVVAFFLGLNTYTSVRANLAQENPGKGEEVKSAAQATLPVEGMTCVTCELAVQASLKKLDGILDAKADAVKGSVTVSYDPKLVTLRQIVETIKSETGYKARLPE